MKHNEEITAPSLAHTCFLVLLLLAFLVWRRAEAAGDAARFDGSSEPFLARTGTLVSADDRAEFQFRNMNIQASKARIESVNDIVSTQKEMRVAR